MTRLCRSLGMCPRHTRGLMSQPGAPSRLTAVNRYLVQAARDQLAGRGARLAGCPACEHDGEAAGRALGTLLDGLDDSQVRERYHELGGHPGWRSGWPKPPCPLSPLCRHPVLAGSPGLTRTLTPG
jgi:hypothetical protein